MTERLRPDGRAIDPVAHFHLSNGARIERLNWQANPSAVGWDRGLGLMVNYRYDLRTIEDNHDRYVGEADITISDGVRISARATAGPTVVAAGAEGDRHLALIAGAHPDQGHQARKRRRPPAEKPGGHSRLGSATGAVNYSLRTFLASSPFRPGAISNSTA